MNNYNNKWGVVYKLIVSRRETHSASWETTSTLILNKVNFNKKKIYIQEMPLALVFSSLVKKQKS